MERIGAARDAPLVVVSQSAGGAVGDGLPDDEGTVGAGRRQLPSRSGGVDGRLASVGAVEPSEAEQQEHQEESSSCGPHRSPQPPAGAPP